MDIIDEFYYRMNHFDNLKMYKKKSFLETISRNHDVHEFINGFNVEILRFMISANMFFSINAVVYSIDNYYDLEDVLGGLIKDLSITNRQVWSDEKYNSTSIHQLYCFCNNFTLMRIFDVLHKNNVDTIEELLDIVKCNWKLDNDIYDPKMIGYIFGCAITKNLLVKEDKLFGVTLKSKPMPFLFSAPPGVNVLRTMILNSPKYYISPNVVHPFIRKAFFNNSDNPAVTKKLRSTCVQQIQDFFVM